MSFNGSFRSIGFNLRCFLSAATGGIICARFGSVLRSVRALQWNIVIEHFTICQNIIIARYIVTTHFSEMILVLLDLQPTLFTFLIVFQILEFILTGLRL